MKSPHDRTAQTADVPFEAEPGAESAGQSGDTQDLPSFSGETEESVQDLVETGQDYQAELVEGMEDAADHPEEPVTTHEDRRIAGDSVDRA